MDVPNLDTLRAFEDGILAKSLVLRIFSRQARRMVRLALVELDGPAASANRGSYTSYYKSRVRKSARALWPYSITTRMLTPIVVRLILEWWLASPDPYKGPKLILLKSEIWACKPKRSRV